MYSDWVLFLLGTVIFVWLGFLTYKITREKAYLKENFFKKGDRDLGQIQKVALLRYNPYGDTGGDMSFSVALLNGLGSGVVLTSLHSRSGTRVFAKEVEAGKQGRHEFSKEEQEVVKKALK